MAISEPTLALLHHSFGPYHVARARVLRQNFPGTVHFIQLAATESLRAWRAEGDDLTIETAAEGVLDAIPPATVAAGLERILDRINPGVIAIAGYGDTGMRHAAKWARRRGARAILLSDSQARDWPRWPWREWVKRRWVSRHFSAAFVSGAAAAAYVEALGIPGHRIWRGYDVVDNDHFAREAAAARTDPERLHAQLGLPAGPFFLYVGRLAPEKNLVRLIEAFSRASTEPTLDGWGLVLVGSGPLEEVLRRQAAPLGDRVRFAGFQQLDRLPGYYGLAAALVLPSLSEPWGLVVNEAMASGLPVIVSHQCGCAMDLVFPGVNGTIVDSEEPHGIAAALVEMAADADRRRAYGQASLRLIQNFSLDVWSRALIGCSLTLV